MGTWTTVNNALASRQTFATWGHSQEDIGAAGGSSGYTNTSEQYDGTSWSSANLLVGAARGYLAGGGTISAGAIFGGEGSGGRTDLTEEYDGTSWSNVNATLQLRSVHGGSGQSQNACLTWGGVTTTTYDSATEEYDGTCWSAGGNFLQATGYFGGSGAQSNTISVGALGNTDLAAVYNGSTWSALANINSTTRQPMTAGDPSSALYAASPYAPQTQTEEFNGTSWSNETGLNTARYRANKTGGSHEAAVIVAGNSGGTSTEEWDDVPFCWNYTARYKNSDRLFKSSGPGSYPKSLIVPNNIDKSTGKMIDDGKEIDNDDYKVN